MHMDDEKNPSKNIASTNPVATTKKSGRCCCITSVLLFLVLVGGAAAVVFLVVFRPPGMEPLESEDYDVAFDKETYNIVLSPKEDATHEYSLIWLHGLNKNTRKEFNYFADQEEGKRLTSLNTKVLIPQAGKMKLSRPPPPPKKKDGEDGDKGGPGGKGEGPGGKKGGPGGKDGLVNSWFDILEGDKPGKEKSEADW